MSSSMFSSSLCFNSECNRSKSERSRKGWRLRNGMHAQLCDPCGNAFEEGKFCEIFHSNSSGWRCCESCGKRIHCGCVVSSYCFVLLDVGGIECMGCAKKNLILPTNMLWPASPCPPTLPEKIIKKLSQKVSSEPWKKITNLFDVSTGASCETRVTMRNDIDGFTERECVPESSLEKNKSKDSFEKSSSDGSKFTALKIPGNESLGFNCEERPVNSPSVSRVPSISKEDTSTPSICSTVPITLPSIEQGQSRGTEICEEKPVVGSLPPPVKPYSDLQNDIKVVSGNQTPVQSHPIQQNGGKLSNGNPTRLGKPKGEPRGRCPLLPRYWPRLTNHELQQMSGDSNSLITPLFEKMLSASDAGRIGRLVLPKKCAEAYFPPIAQPEGLPLKVQDAKGQEWVFQFRFWPNNNSRMYVLEGVTPCIQSMQLQAGDTVTFSRLDPEGKLIMGFRKTSNDQANQEDEGGHGFSVCRDVSVNVSNSACTWSQADKSGYIAKDMIGSKSCSQKKRRYSSLFPKNKRLKIESRDMIELKITWEEAQDLLRPPPTSIANVVVIEGYEFEEFEEEPVIGRPTIFSKDDTGAGIQWAQCEECFKWRKIPFDALLPLKWVCSENRWDPERSTCSTAEEMKEEQLEELLPNLNNGTMYKRPVKYEDAGDTVEGLDGLEALAKVAVMGERDDKADECGPHTTTKHPRHRPGCSCIVCIQPPSGKGPKHEQSCTCSVCLTVRRRFQTLMLRREKKLSERGETARCRPKPPPGECILSDSAETSSSNSSGEKRRKKGGRGKGKGKFDLNIKPEREEETATWTVGNTGLADRCTEGDGGGQWGKITNLITFT